MENKPVLETNVVKPKLAIFENETEYRLLSYLSEMSLDIKIAEVENFMNNNHGRGKSEEEKDELYSKAKEVWGNYTQELRDTEYTFYLNRKQYVFLTELLRDKLEYDVNTIFLAIELTEMLGEWHEEGAAKDDTTLKGYTADATEVTYIYHLIAKHKIKGLGHSSYRFSEILRKIGDISKIVSYYDTHAKSLSTDIQKWVATFDEGVTVDGKDFSVEPIRPKKKKDSKAETESETEA